MGSESRPRWWQRLFQRGSWLRRSERYGELGSDPFESLARQADFEVELLRQVVYDEELDMEITIEWVCVCGLPVAKISEENNFICLHCDRGCQLGMQKCPYCLYAMQDRVEEYVEDEED